jgi:hypothetical protein
VWRALLAVVVLTGCASVCPQESTLTGADGGALFCVLGTDCPRPSNVLVCGATEDQLRGCVGCKSGSCVRYTPQACP